MYRASMVVMLLVLLGCNDPPSDAQLIGHFRSHRTAYERVVSAMAEKPLITRIEFTEDRSGNVQVETSPVQIGGDRLRTLEFFYRSTSVEVIDGAVEAEKVVSVTFVNYRSGIVGRGKAKGIAYRSRSEFLDEERKNGALLSRECLDKYSPPSRSYGALDGMAYCRIDEHWYLFFSRS